MAGVTCVFASVTIATTDWPDSSALRSEMSCVAERVTLVPSGSERMIKSAGRNWVRAKS